MNGKREKFLFFIYLFIIYLIEKVSDNFDFMGTMNEKENIELGFRV